MLLKGATSLFAADGVVTVQYSRDLCHDSPTGPCHKLHIPSFPIPDISNIIRPGRSYHSAGRADRSTVSFPFQTLLKAGSLSCHRYLGVEYGDYKAQRDLASFFLTKIVRRINLSYGGVIQGNHWIAKTFTKVSSA